MGQYWEQLLDHLGRTRRVKASRVQQLLEEEPHWADRPEQMLVEHRLLSKEDLLRAKSELMGVPEANVLAARLDPAVVGIVPQAMANRYGAVCIGREGDRIVLAMVDPNDAFALDYIQMRTGYEIERRVAFAGDVEQAIEKLYVNGPPVGRAPGSIRDRVGAEMVRGRSLDRGPIARPRRIDVDDDITETPLRPQTPVSSPRGARVKLGTLPGSAAIAPSNARVALDLARLSLDLIAELDEDALIDRILDTAMRLFSVEAASLLLIDWEKSQLFFREARGPVMGEILEMALPLDPETSVAAWCAAHKKVVNIADTSADPRHNDALDKQLGYNTKTLLAAPVIWGDDVLGVIELVNRVGGPFDDEDVEFVSIMAAQVALALHNTMAVRQLHNFYQQSLETLIDCYQAFDPVSRHHVVNVARLATGMGRELGLSNTDMEALTYAALLHDIGKIKCADPSDPQHTEIGASMLQQVTLFNRLVPAVRYHHERYDGSGPYGLAGDDIPVLARLLSVAEAWCEESLPAVRDSGVPFGDALQAFMPRFGPDFDASLRGAFENSVTLAVA